MILFICRKRRVEMEKAQSSEKVSNLSQNTPVVSKTLKTSQKSLLIGAIKRKSEPLEQENASKKRRELPFLLQFKHD